MCVTALTLIAVVVRSGDTPATTYVLVVPQRHVLVVLHLYPTPATISPTASRMSVTCRNIAVPTSHPQLIHHTDCPVSEVHVVHVHPVRHHDR